MKPWNPRHRAALGIGNPKVEPESSIGVSAGGRAEELDNTSRDAGSRGLDGISGGDGARKAMNRGWELRRELDPWTTDR